MNNIYILIGGNLGNREKIFSEAKKLIQHDIGKIAKTSSIYETQPWGFNSDKPFLNQVILIHTEYSAVKTLTLLLNIEKKLGRNRTSENYESRQIDLDILLFNDSTIYDEQLQVPHPRLHQRMFTLIPLNEIVPDKIHPLLNEKICTLMEKCSDPLKVNLYKPTS